MKIDRKTLILTTLICLIPIVVGAAVYGRLPETMATHWNMNGEPDGWSSRAFAVFGLPGILLAVNLLLPFALKADPKRANMSDKLVMITLWIIPMISLLCCGLTLARGLGYEVRVERWVPVFMGVLFIVIGNYLPKTKQSYTMGIKLPWTLNSEENWNRTHRLAGYLWVACGILMALLTLLKIGRFWLMPALIAVMVLVPTIYSYSLYKKGI